MEIGNSKLETGNVKLEIGNLKSEIRDSSLAVEFQACKYQFLISSF